MQSRAERFVKWPAEVFGGKPRVLNRRVVYRRLVQRAVEICGDKRTLAVLLNVTVDEVTSWANGRTALPAHIYPRVIEILLDHEQERLRSQIPKDRHSDLVQRAVELCGDKKRLAVILNVSVDEITSWAEGQTQVPDAILLRILILRSADGGDASH